MPSHDLLPRNGGDSAAEESGVTHWSYEELSTVTEISREAGLPIQAHFGQMWAFPAVGNGVDPDEALPEVSSRPASG